MSSRRPGIAVAPLDELLAARGVCLGEPRIRAEHWLLGGYPGAFVLLGLGIEPKEAATLVRRSGDGWMEARTARPLPMAATVHDIGDGLGWLLPLPAPRVGTTDVGARRMDAAFDLVAGLGVAVPRLLDASGRRAGEGEVARARELLGAFAEGVCGDPAKDDDPPDLSFPALVLGADSVRRVRQQSDAAGALNSLREMEDLLFPERLLAADLQSLGLPPDSRGRKPILAASLGDWALQAVGIESLTLRGRLLVALGASTESVAMRPETDLRRGGRVAAGKASAEVARAARRYWQERPNLDPALILDRLTWHVAHRMLPMWRVLARSGRDDTR